MQQRQTLENELNAIKDVRLNTLLCIVTSDWAFQVGEGAGRIPLSLLCYTFKLLTVCMYSS